MSTDPFQDYPLDHLLWSGYTRSVNWYTTTQKSHNRATGVSAADISLRINGREPDFVRREELAVARSAESDGRYC